MSDGPTYSLNGETRPWEAASVSAVLDESGIDVARGGVAVARNGEVVPRAQWDQTAVQPDDRIEIVHIVRGG